MGVLLFSDLLWDIRQTSLWSLSICGLHLSLRFGLEGAVKSTQLCEFKKDLGDTEGDKGRGKSRKSCSFCSYKDPRKSGPRWEPLSGMAWQVTLG